MVRPPAAGGHDVASGADPECLQRQPAAGVAILPRLASFYPAGVAQRVGYLHDQSVIAIRNAGVAISSRRVTTLPGWIAGNDQPPAIV